MNPPLFSEENRQQVREVSRVVFADWLAQDAAAAEAAQEAGAAAAGAAAGMADASRELSADLTFVVEEVGAETGNASWALYSGKYEVGALVHIAGSDGWLVSFGDALQSKQFPAQEQDQAFERVQQLWHNLLPLT